MRSLSLVPALALFALVGCVEREMVIESDPPAEVFLDGRFVGKAERGEPLRVPFDDYGTREVVARAPGHQPRRLALELEVPWYQVFPLGLFSDLLWPGTIRDEHPVSLRLEPRGDPGSAAEVAERAAAFAAGAARE